MEPVRDALHGRLQIARLVGFHWRLFEPGQCEHACGEVLHTLRIDQQALQPGLVLAGGSRAQREQLQAGLQHRDRGLQLVRGIAGKLPLALEGLTQPVQQALNGKRDRSQLRGVKDLVRRHEFPRA
jgi:hypothetical protein